MKMTKKSKNKSQKKLSRLSIVIALDISSLIIGAALGVVFDRYVYPLYFVPHSHLRVMQEASEFTIDNIQGNAPIEWVKITIRATNGVIQNISMIQTSFFDIGNRQFSREGNAYGLMINHVTPNDWAVVRMEISGSQNYTLEVWSSSQYVFGDKVSIGNAPTHGAWGPEESFGDWLKEHPSYNPTS